MKYIFIFILTGFSPAIFAQTPFEGKIVYSLHALQEKENMELTVFFGKKVLRIEFKAFNDKNKADLEYAIVRLDSGTIIAVSPDNKTYRLSALKRKTTMPAIIRKEIAGYKTTPVYTNVNNLYTEFLYMIRNGVLYTADDLYFPVPEQYEGNQELMMVHNNKIVLGAEFDVSDENWRGDAGRDSAVLSKNALVATATLVARTEIDTLLFNVPSGFSPYTRTMDSDTATMSIDPVIPLSKKSTKKRGTKVPVKMKPTTKQSALRRTDD